MALLFLGLAYFGTRDSLVMPRNASDNSFEQFTRTAKDLRFRYSPRVPKPRQQSMPVSNQMVIKEKRKGFADRGKEYAGFVVDNTCRSYPVLSGPVGFCQPFNYQPRHLSDCPCIRPPPAC